MDIVIDNSNENRGYIYCIGSSECPCGRVKIGLAIDPITRLNQLQAGSPCELEIKWQVEVEDRFSAEKIIHAELDLWNIRREWFSLPEQVIKALGDNLKLFHKGNVLEAVKAAVSTDPKIRFSGSKAFLAFLTEERIRNEQTQAEMVQPQLSEV